MLCILIDLFSIERKLTLLGKVESAILKRGDDFERNEKEEEEDELLERVEEETNEDEDEELDPPEETEEQIKQALEEALEKEELEEAEKEGPQGVSEFLGTNKEDSNVGTYH